MLNLNDALVVCALFLSFMDVEQLRQRLGSIGISVWMKNPYVKECFFHWSPKSPSTDIQSCIVLMVSGSLKLLTSEWYETRLCLDISTYFLEEICFDITHLVVTHNGVPTKSANKGMID